MIGAGTVINPILKVVTTLAILAAVSIFIIKPILDTTESSSDAAREQSERISREAEERSRAIELRVSRTIALSAVQTARLSGDNARAQRILECIRRAGDNPDKMDFCRAR